MDADPVREHVNELREFGIGWMRIADAAGVPRTVVGSLLYGRKNRPPNRRVRPATAEKLMAVTPSMDLLPDGAWIDGTGTRRRVQALAARGWPLAWLERRLGLARKALSAVLRRRDRVTARTARAVRDLYDELWDQEPPTGDRWQKTAVATMRRYAADQGWVPPLAWDDDAIDDPDAGPDPDALGDARRRLADVVEDVEELERLGEPPERVAARVGVRPESVARYKLRARKRLGVSAA